MYNWHSFLRIELDCDTDLQNELAVHQPIPQPKTVKTVIKQMQNRLFFFNSYKNLSVYMYNIAIVNYNMQGKSSSYLDQISCTYGNIHSIEEIVPF